MNRKEILFVIHDLEAGGAQKALVSLLHAIPKDKYEIDLITFTYDGLFKDQLPEKINVIKGLTQWQIVKGPITDLRVWKTCSPSLIIDKIKKGLKIGWDRNVLSYGQYVWRTLSKHVYRLEKHYDVAISFMHGTSNYFVMDCIRADKKILWMHTDYNKIMDYPDFDLKYFQKSDWVATISNSCVKILQENFPTIKNKFIKIENISDSRLIHRLSQEVNDEPFFHDCRFKILSIGRLIRLKGFDLAIEAANKMHRKDIDFCWYIIGEGRQRDELERKISEYGLNSNMVLLGLKANPYPYMAKADVFCMPSRYEGKSIALDEAMILAKPIVVTNYPTVHDAVKNYHNAVISDINADSIFDGIMKLFDSPILRKQLSDNLEKEDFSNKDAVLNQLLPLWDK